MAGQNLASFWGTGLLEAALQAQYDPFSSKSGQDKKFLVSGLCLLVASVLLALFGIGVLRLGQRAPGAVTRAGGSSGPAFTQASSKPPAPVTAAGATAQPVTEKTDTVRKMPPEVMDWLKHLAETERRQGILVQGQLSEMAVLRDQLSLGGVSAGDFEDPEKALDRTPTEKAMSKTAPGPKEWDALNDFFESKPPPTECVPIKNAYSQAMGETKAYFVQINGILSDVTASMGDPDKSKEAITALQKIGTSNKGSIDVARDETDKLVGEICDKYQTRKWFKISPDIGGGLGPLLRSVLGG